MVFILFPYIICYYDLHVEPEESSLMQLRSVIYLPNINNNMKKTGWFRVWEKDMKPSTSKYHPRITA